VANQVLEEDEILTLKKMVEPKESKQKLKEEEIKFIRDQIKQKEETSEAEADKQEIQEEEPVTDEIKETESLEVEKREEIPAQPATEDEETTVEEPEKEEIVIEKEVEEKPPEPEEKPELPKPEKKKKAKAKLETHVIEDVKIVKITDLWRKKPKFLSSESHAIIVTVKTPEGKKVKQTFYAYIKPDRTFNIKSGRTKTRIQKKFINFLQHYKLADNLVGYKILERAKEWKGKAIGLDKNEKIVIPKEI